MPPIFRDVVISDPTTMPGDPKFRSIPDYAAEQIPPAAVPVSAYAGNVLYRRNDGLYASVTGSAVYMHVQSTPADRWDVQHNLGSNPVSVTVFDDAGDLVLVYVDYPGATLNMVSVVFAAPATGVAYAKPL